MKERRLHCAHAAILLHAQRGEEMHSILPWGIAVLILVVPIKLAADFADGTNTGLIACAFSSILALGLSILTFTLSSKGFGGLACAGLVGLCVYAAILRIPARSIMGFAIIAIALQLAVVAALASLGVHMADKVLST